VSSPLAWFSRVAFCAFGRVPGRGEATAAHDALKRALDTADTLAAIFRAAETRLLIAAARRLCAATYAMPTRFGTMQERVCCEAQTNSDGHGQLATGPPRKAAATVVGLGGRVGP
jgi:hypothetical protein